MLYPEHPDLVDLLFLILFLALFHAIIFLVPLVTKYIVMSLRFRSRHVTHSGSLNDTYSLITLHSECRISNFQSMDLFRSHVLVHVYRTISL